MNFGEESGGEGSIGGEILVEEVGLASAEDDLRRGRVRTRLPASETRDATLSSTSVIFITKWTS